MLGPNYLIHDSESIQVKGTRHIDQIIPERFHKCLRLCITWAMAVREKVPNFYFSQVCE